MLKRLSILAGSSVLGFSVWALSPYLTGFKEPWDAPYPFYSAVLFVGGVLIALAARRRDALCGVGVWLGQVLALNVLPGLDRSWILLGTFTVIGGAIVSALGNLAGSALSGFWKETARK